MIQPSTQSGPRDVGLSAREGADRTGASIASDRPGTAQTTTERLAGSQTTADRLAGGVPAARHQGTSAVAERTDVNRPSYFESFRTRPPAFDPLAAVAVPRPAALQSRGADVAAKAENPEQPANQPGARDPAPSSTSGNDGETHNDERPAANPEQPANRPGAREPAALATPSDGGDTRPPANPEQPANRPGAREPAALVPPSGDGDARPPLNPEQPANRPGAREPAALVTPPGGGDAKPPANPEQPANRPGAREPAALVPPPSGGDTRPPPNPEQPAHAPGASRLHPAEQDDSIAPVNWELVVGSGMPGRVGPVVREVVKVVGAPSGPPQRNPPYDGQPSLPDGPRPH